jgi:phage-related baseplate assembly protein
MVRRRAVFLPLAIVAVLAACNAEAPLTVCTASFAAITAIVRAADGSAVPGLTISDTVLRTREGFVVGQAGTTPLRARVVLDDSFRTRIRPSGDSVRVAGTNGTVGFSADFVFDVPGDCHVQKVAGPDSVTVS